MGKTSGPRPLPESVDVLIIGAGPHGLAMASRLILGSEAMQDIIAPQESYIKKPKEVRDHLKKMRSFKEGEVAVIDNSGAWMRRWQNQFAVLAIQFLRSNEMMHPDAFDHSVLPVWAKEQKRNDFFFLDDLPKDSIYHGPFTLPSNKMMCDFCRHLVRHYKLENFLWEGSAESMRPCEGGMEVSVSTKDGDVKVFARNVVVARGPTWRRQWPEFYRNLETAALAEVRHAWDLFDKPEEMEKLKGRGVIIGGGLTSAHLCTLLAPRGDVTLLIRRELKLKQYDLELSWMGTGRRSNRKDYEAMPLEARPGMNKAVRDGGSITPELHARMERCVKQGTLKVCEYAEVITASLEDDFWTVVLSDDEVLSADYIICATGTFVDISTDPLLKDLQRTHPIQVLANLPVLTERLQWGEAPVFLMGNIAALELGPDAVNMNGATRGALRISAGIYARRSGTAGPSGEEGPSGEAGCAAQDEQQ